jgi:hypothetical protein
MHFHPLNKNRKKILKNIKFGFQIYFNMKNTLNGRIGLLKSEMKDTT